VGAGACAVVMYGNGEARRARRSEGGRGRSGRDAARGGVGYNRGRGLRGLGPTSLFFGRVDAEGIVGLDRRAGLSTPRRPQGVTLLGLLRVQ